MNVRRGENLGPTEVHLRSVTCPNGDEIVVANLEVLPARALGNAINQGVRAYEGLRQIAIDVGRSAEFIQFVHAHCYPEGEVVAPAYTRTFESVRPLRAIFDEEFPGTAYIVTETSEGVSRAYYVDD